jgi:hypothetical protein
MYTPQPVREADSSRTILFAPFVPLVVLFCHIIQSPKDDDGDDDDDLRRLADFAASLQPLCTVSEAIDRLHALAQVLHNIASLHARSRAPGGAGDHKMAAPPVGSDLAVLLSQDHQAGLVMEEQRAFEGASGVLPFADLFTDDVNMIELLEESLSGWER